jgi:hypothetical protein
MVWNNKENIAKYEGKCWHPAKHKYCYYWRAKLSKSNNNVIGYFCSLFDEDKEGYGSLPECNSKYGRTYDGRV